MNKLLYRYINWNDLKSKRLLSENEFYFYSAQEWEKDGEYQFELLDFTESAIYNIVMEIAIDMHNTNYDEYKRWMIFHAEKYGFDFSKLTEVELDLIDQHFASEIAKERSSHPDKFKEGQKQLYFNRTGIISLSEDKRSYNLWSSKRNSNGDNIICLGIDLNLLKSILSKIPNCFMDKVIYSNELKKFQIVFDKTGYKSLLQLLAISFTLNTKFKQEKEVRIQRLLIDNSENSIERKIILPNDIFKEMIIFKDADAETQSEVTGIAKLKGIPKLLHSEILYDDNTVSIF